MISMNSPYVTYVTSIWGCQKTGTTANPFPPWFGITFTLKTAIFLAVERLNHLKTAINWKYPSYKLTNPTKKNHRNHQGELTHLRFVG